MIRDEATQAQVDAADPTTATWLSANAGSGKTRVLTDRVARLLLDGVMPQNILCLTYTKAAAAEMQNRLFRRLGAWAMKDDSALRDELRTLGVEGTIDTATLNDARTLFARAIETPGGLKIQTIHSFCASILRRFPREAGVSPQFKEMEDRTAALLRAEALDDMAQDPADRPLLHDLLRHYTGGDTDTLVREIASRRADFATPLDTENLRSALNLTAADTTARILSDTFNPDTLEVLRDLIAVMRVGSSTEQKAAALLETIDTRNPTLHDVATLEGPFLFGAKAKAGPFTAKVGKFPTAPTRKANPELAEALDDVMLLVQDNRQPRLALNLYHRTVTLHAFAGRFLSRFAAKKTSRGMLDFDDLIEKARQLLTDDAVAAWVLYRLDGGIDHVLVDEAQDTSPTQWSVIRHLTQELTAGIGARDDRDRTIFVVGDKKQSIYSFQGADPDEFDRMETYFRDALTAIDRPLQSRELAFSFRSSPAILRAVDETFARSGVEGLGDHIAHRAFHNDMPGRVDLWPVVAPADDDAPTDWFTPVDQVSANHHNITMAQRIATQIKHMIAHETLPVSGPDNTFDRRNITEGDILILVQKRSGLFPEIIRACKTAGLRVAGADRLKVAGELAVRDVAALLNFLALPEDDLSLAAALRSPLFGWSEQDLFSLAQPRPDRGHLWPALRDSTGHPDTMRIIHDLRKNADFLRPYDLIERILTRHNGRQNLLARLGTEAEDGIDALLSQALAYESTGVPSLTGFLAWMETDDLEIKRQMDSQSDQIRVMSIHGAKGLEAPIVILPDCGERVAQFKSELLDADDTLLWKAAVPDMPDSALDLRDAAMLAQEREKMRLLYVAMTRAENWLIVGAAGDIKDNGTTWYEIVSAGLDHVDMVDAKSGSLDIARSEHGIWSGGNLVSKPVAFATKTPPATFEPLMPVTRTATLSPSDLGGEKALSGETSDADPDTALARGRVIHLLLEHLPALPASDRAGIARRLIDAGGEPLNRAQSDAAIATALRLIDTPALAHIFAPDTLAEVGITANLPGVGARIHGSIDRLLMTDTQITAIDFKSNHVVPDSPDTVPDGILRQMGAYAAALAHIYPDHDIATAILWTQTAEIMVLPPHLVSSALSRVTIP